VLHQPTQLDRQQGGLDLVQAAVPADLVVHVLLGRPVVAQRAEPVGDVRVRRRHGTAVAEGAQVLPRVEAPGGRVGQTPDRDAPVPGAVRLCGVVEHHEAVPPRQRQDRVEVHGVSVEMDREERPSPWADGVLDSVRRPPAGHRAGVDGHGDGAHVHDRQPGGDEGVGRHHDLVAGPHAERAEAQREGVQPVPDAHGRAGADEGCPPGLEGRELRTQQDPLAAQHPEGGLGELVLQFDVQCGEVEQRHLYGSPDHASTAPYRARTKSSWSR
jgi:hypothetical protein